MIGSMPVEQISTALRGDFAPGSQLTPACYLQLYLAYARAVSEGNSERAQAILGRLAEQSARVGPVRNGPESPFEEEVLQAVRQPGYDADCQVGDSGFRIDLGVLHPTEPKRGYLLGIECDGATYHSDRAARSRDVWREKILTDHGWRLYRVWSTRWWYNRGEEVENLRSAIEQALTSMR
ncbi:MAG TPA: hypothetical protein VFW33_03470 [Gemmataceae bacterium]|nr:hypothetical protein [Gemmataceae bacterium]